MIVLFFGQPTSGKTTLANAFVKEMKSKCMNDFIQVDGDEWRELSKNKDYSKEGRIANLKSAFTMAKFLDNNGFTPILSFVTPYQELRDYLADGNEVLFFYLTHNHIVEDRGRNKNFALDFEVPTSPYLEPLPIHLNTSIISEEDALDKVVEVFIAKN